MQKAGGHGREDIVGSLKVDHGWIRSLTRSSHAIPLCAVELIAVSEIDRITINVHV